MANQPRIRVGFLTNLTSEVNLEVLNALTVNPKLEFAHIFFYDTLAAGRKSILKTLRQHGLKKVLAKATGIILNKVPLPRGAKTPRSCYDFASANGLPLTVVRDMNEPTIASQIQSLDLDFVVVCVCKNILKEPLLAEAKTCFVNIHPSVLPAYRGPSPTFWMLFNGETQTGATVHLISKGIDRGPILHQFSMPLDRHKTEPEIETEVFARCAHDIGDTLLAFHAGNLTPQEQTESGSYQSYPTTSQRAELARRLVQESKPHSSARTESPAAGR